MTRAFLYVTICGLVNRTRVRLRRLREPRYAIGLAVGVLYFYGVLFGRAGGGRGHAQAAGLAALSTWAEPATAAASVVLFVIVSLYWIWPSSARAITFTRAEVQFLFAAPLTRRQLLHYKLIRSLTASFLGSAIVTLFFRPGTLLSAWTVVTGMWLLFGILNLHFTGIALARESLAQHGASGLRRQWLPIAVIVGALAALGVAISHDGPHLASLQTGEQVFTELGHVLTTGVAGWALWPTRTIVRLPLSQSAGAYWRAMPGALLLFGLNYVWVMRTDAAFEEAAAEQSEKVVRGRIAPSPARVTALSTPFSLADSGPAETAIMWKNLILLGRYASLRTLWRIVPLVIALAAAASGSGKHGLVSALSIFVLAGSGLAILLGPQIVRNDLRQDLANLSLLKTWPVRSAAIIRGELLAPTAILTVVAWILVIASVFLIANLPSSTSRLATVVLNRLPYGIAALVLAPPVIIIQLLVQNGLAVVFPAWAIIGATRSRGLDVMGQRLLMQAGIWLAVLLAALPAALVGGLVAVGVYAVTGILPIVVPAFLAAAVILAEAFLATEALGRALDRADVGSLEPRD